MSAMFTPSSVFCRTEPEMSSSSLASDSSAESCPPSSSESSDFLAGVCSVSDGEEPSDGTVSSDSEASPADVVLTVPVAAEALTADPVSAEADALTNSGTLVPAKAVCDLKMFGRLLVALWLAAVAVESLESRAPGTLSPSSLTFSASLDTSGDVVAAEAVDAVTAKVPTSATEAQPATVGNRYFIVTAFSRKTGKFRPRGPLHRWQYGGQPQHLKIVTHFRRVRLATERNILITRVWFPVLARDTPSKSFSRNRRRPDVFGHCSAARAASGASRHVADRLCVGFIAVVSRVVAGTLCQQLRPGTGVRIESRIDSGGS